MKDFNVVVQFCLAHFIRDVKFLAQHPQKKNREYGELLLEHFKQLFRAIHRRDEFASEASFQRRLTAIRNALVHDAVMRSPGTRESDNLADRFVNHLLSFFTFITTPEVEPTNNLAEQALRFVAIHRRMTQGTRSIAGRQWCERIWTAITTCEQQGRSLFDFLHAAVCNHFHGTPAPTLVPGIDSS